MVRSTYLNLAIILCACSHLNAQLQSVDGGLSSWVKDLELNDDSTRLIAVGSFTYTLADSLRANGIAQWDGTTWDVSPFAGGDGDTSLHGNFVPELSVSQFRDTLFVGTGQDRWHHDPSVYRCVYLTNNQWHPCGNPDNQFWVEQEQGRLFGYGRADTLYGQYMPNVSEWVGGAWQTLPNTPFDELGSVYCVTYWKNQFYFGGSFWAIGSRKFVAFDGMDTWTFLDSTLGGQWINTMQGYGDSLFVGGALPNTGLSDHLVIWDGGQWLPFFSEVTFLSQVFDIKEHEGMLYISGRFNLIGDNTDYGLLRFDGKNLCVIGGMMNFNNHVMEFFQGDLYLATGYSYQPLYGQHIGRLELDGLIPDTCIQVTQTHVNELQADRQVFIHPNPARTSVTINCPNCTGATQVSVFNVLGEQMLLGAVTPSQMRIAVDQLQPGTYVVRLRSQDGEAWYGRFVKH